MSQSLSYNMSSSSHEIILISSPDGHIIAYDASSGTPLTRFTDSRSPRGGLTLVGKSFIAASHISPTTASGSIHLYNWWSSTALYNLPVPEPVAPITSTPEGLYLFAGGISGTVYSHSIPSGNVLKSLPLHNKPVSCLTINDDGSLLISGGDDGTIFVIPIFQLLNSTINDNVEDLIMHKFVAHSSSVTAIISGLGFCNSQIVSCSLDCTCKFWSLLRGTHLNTVMFPCSILAIELNPIEFKFYAAGSDGSVYKVLLKVGKKKVTSPGYELVKWNQCHIGGIVSLALVNERRNLVTASEDGSIWIWEVDAGKAILVLRNEIGTISDLLAITGINYYSVGNGMRMSDGVEGSSESVFGLSVEELMRLPVKHTIEMEEALKVAERDTNRAINMLESAISMYERLLELIVKEAERGNINNRREKENNGM